MRPKTHREVQEEMIKETGVDGELLRDLTDFYWKKFVELFMGLKHIKIYAINFGSFLTRQNKLTEEYTKLNAQIKSGKLNTATSYKLKARRDLIEKNLRLWEIQKEKKTRIKNARKGIFTQDDE